MAEQNSVLPPLWVDRLIKMWRWQRNFRVRGAAEFKNTEDSCAISIPAAPAPAQPTSGAKLKPGQYYGQMIGTTSQLTLGAMFVPIINTSPV